MANSEADILRMLTSVRRRVRGLLALHGAAVLVCAVLLGALVTSLLDWWVRFPSMIRALILTGGLAWIITWSLRRILKPLTAPLPLAQLALRLGTETADDRERLASAVSFLDGHASGSDDLWRHVLTTSKRQAAAADWRRGIHRRGTLKVCAFAVGCCVLATWLRSRVPDHFDVGGARLLAPWTVVEWPRSVKILPLTRDLRAALGESAVVRMRLVRGDGPYQRAYVNWGTPGGERRRSLMQREATGVYRFSIEDIRVPLQYDFVAGDDDTRDRPGHITAARRPSVASAQLVLTPPPYATGVAVETLVLGREAISAVRGSRARLEVTPLATEGLAVLTSGKVRFLGGGELDLSSDAEREGVLTTEFDVDGSKTLQIRLVDQGGLESSPATTHEILAIADQEPEVRIVEPTGDFELTPRGMMDLRIAASDDFGITSLRIMAGLEGQEARPVVEVLNSNVEQAADETSTGRGAPPDLSDVDNLSENESRVGTAPRTVDRRASWSLRTTMAKPGQEYTCFAECTDNFELAGARHTPRRSAPLHIRLVSESEFSEGLRQSLTAIAARLRRMAMELQSLRTETTRLDERPSTRQAMTDQDRNGAVRLSREIGRWSATGATAADELFELVRRAEQNQASRLDTALEASRLGRSIRKLSRDGLRDVSASIEAASDADTAADQHQLLQSALVSEDHILATMRNLLDTLERRTEIADLTRMIQELLDRQEELARQSARLWKSQGGLIVNDLSDAQRQGLASAADGQQQLRSETIASIRTLSDMAGSIGATDPVIADALERAAAVSRDQGVIEKMTAAAAEIDANRFRSAQRMQEAAAMALRAMLAAMESRVDRELAALSKSLTDLVTQVEKLIQSQDEVIERAGLLATTVPDALRTASVVDRQRTLGRTTEGLAGKIEAGDADGMTARVALMMAAGHMDAASVALERTESAAAQAEQANSREQLVEARDALTAMQKRVDRDLAERSLAAIQEDLSALRDAQYALREETSALASRRESASRTTRAEGAKLKSLVQRQQALVQPANALSERMQGAIVFRRVCDRIGEQIAIAAGELLERRADKAAATQGLVLADLDRLLEAVERRSKKSRNRFADADAGGGGAGAPTATRPVPPLAELLVLRAMQTELAERTRAMNESLPDPIRRSESQLQAIESLGREQRELHDLSARIIQGAQNEP